MPGAIHRAIIIRVLNSSIFTVYEALLRSYAQLFMTLCIEVRSWESEPGSTDSRF